MAAKLDCDTILRSNTGRIQQSFIDGKITITDAKILYQRELDAYAACRGTLTAAGFIENPPVNSSGRFVTMINGRTVFVPSIKSTCRTCNKG